ncbi:MAG: hypothetical protein ACKVQQ_16785 [Burkholderiales bacterium]
MKPIFQRVCALVMVTCVGLANAGPGHDHGDDKPVAAANIAPRFSAHSELFELTGVVGDRRIVLYLDEYATNRPIGKAVVDIEIKGPDGAARKLAVASGEGDTFVVALTAALAPGTFAVTSGVTAIVDGKEESDLLAATLEIAAPAGLADDAGHSHGVDEFLPWIGGAVAASVALLALGWRTRTRRLSRVGSTA